MLLKLEDFVSPSGAVHRADLVPHSLLQISGKSVYFFSSTAMGESGVFIFTIATVTVLIKERV